MKTIAVLLSGAFILFSGAAGAQTATAGAEQAPTKPAVKIGKDNPAPKPIAGKSSFTSAQAKTRMEGRGYDIVSNPIEDEKGIWYAEGKKSGGQTVQVMLDYQGNVFESGEYKGHPSSAPGVDPTLPNPVTKAPPPGAAK